MRRSAWQDTPHDKGCKIVVAAGDEDLVSYFASQPLVQVRVPTTPSRQSRAHYHFFVEQGRMVVILNRRKRNSIKLPLQVVPAKIADWLTPAVEQTAS